MRRNSLVGLGFLAAAGCVSLPGCSSDSAAPTPTPGPDASTGGSASGGKTSAAGGKTATGGTTASGGTSASGGTTASGGAGGAGTGGAAAGGTANDAGTGGTDAGTGGTDAGTGGTDAGTGTGGIANDASPSVVTCGSGPYARLWVGGGTIVDHPTSDITVSGSSCPSTTLTLTPKKPGSPPGTLGSDAQFFDVPSNVPFHLRATQTGSFPYLGQEFLPDKASLIQQLLGYVPEFVSMAALDSHFDSLDPSWNPSTRAILLLQITKLPGATGTCATKDGVTVTVDNHPEATGKNGLTPIVTDVGSTGDLIYVTLAGGPELLTLTLTKSPCSLKTTGYEASPGVQTQLTGKYPVEAGALSGGLAVIGN